MRGTVRAAAVAAVVAIGVSMAEVMAAEKRGGVGALPGVPVLPAAT